MAEEFTELLGDFIFHCTICGMTRPGGPAELLRDVEDDSLWPHCCGARMAVLFDRVDDSNEPGTSRS